jgi:uncharacterized protein (TIGR02246 family)
MVSRWSITLAGCLAAAACGNAPPQTAVLAAEEEALEQLRAYYVDHYNMGHGDMVAALYVDDAVGLQANGRVLMGRPAFDSYLATELAAAPVLDIVTDDRMVFGDNAVARGTYTVRVTPPGATAVTTSGGWLTIFSRVNGEWRIASQITNYDAPPPDGSEYFSGTNAAPADEGLMAEFVRAWEAAYNAGDAAAVAALYTADGKVSFPDSPAAEGRAAIEARLREGMMDGTARIEIHDVGSMDLGGGWLVDGGWYGYRAMVEGAQVENVGGYLSLMRQAADGSWQTHWSVVNSRPRPQM